MHASLIPSLDTCERNRQKLLAIADGATDEQISQVPSFGGWSMLQVMYHLTQAEGMTLAYLEKKIQQPSAILPASMLSSAKAWLGTQIMASRLKFKANAAISGLDAPPSRTEVIALWDQHRANLRAFAENLDPQLIHHLVYRHPAVGRMTMKQTFNFLSAHIQHHIVQMKRIHKDITTA